MIAVIDICGNNLTSLGNALTRLGYDYQLTHDPVEIREANQVILPGVGAAGPAMKALREQQLIETLSQLTQPLLGICLGMQLLFTYSEEDQVDCLNLIPGRIQRIQAEENFPVPHMGWSKLKWTKPCSLSEGFKKEDYVYFVHGYALFEKDYALATCQYSQTFSAIVNFKNRYGMQFHPEKSAETGLKLLKNFLELVKQ